MPALPAALALFVTGAALAGVAVAGVTVVAPGVAAEGQRPPDSTVAKPADPRQGTTVLPTGSPAGVPPGPAGDLASTTPTPGAGITPGPGIEITPAPSEPVGNPPFHGCAAPGRRLAVFSDAPIVPLSGHPAALPGTRPATCSLAWGSADRLSGGFGWPVAGAPSVIRAFAPGPHPWSPGHRGVDVVGAGSTVQAAGPGSVTFAGSIAGRGVVVVEHAAGLRTTYEPVSARVPVGQVVRRGEPIGSLQPAAKHCTRSPCLHWGARIGDRYVDPVRLIGRVHRPPVLLPLLTEAGWVYPR